MLGRSIHFIFCLLFLINKRVLHYLISNNDGDGGGMEYDHEIVIIMVMMEE